MSNEPKPINPRTRIGHVHLKMYIRPLDLEAPLKELSPTRQEKILLMKQ